LYFFQFPVPFPEFIQKPTSPTSTKDSLPPNDTSRKVAFTDDVKMEQSSNKDVDSSKEPENQQPKIDGIIGRLEIHRSGAVKMHLANGILLDVRSVQVMQLLLLTMSSWQVNAATQPSFLQQAVYLDEKEKRLIVLGEVNKRFSVSPNVEKLLAAMEAADRDTTILDGENLIRMDAT
jgi:DNA-directed RNA polymerase III subunit RPC4